MASHRTLTSQPQGLQNWFTDPDDWICRFSANVNLSRLQPKRDAAHLEHTCENCSRDSTAKNRNTTIQTSPLTPVTLHDVIVNGSFMLKARKRKDTFRNNEDFLNIFKGTDDFAYYDYVLTTVTENGRKHILKYIRSKI